MSSQTDDPTTRILTPAQVSAGLPWAIGSLALDIIEVLVLTEIIFFDRPRLGVGFGFGFLEIYFIISLAATIGQAIGTLLAARGWYRIGGIFQIVSSAAQVVKGDGIFGVVGGVKAYRYAGRAKAADADGAESAMGALERAGGTRPLVAVAIVPPPARRPIVSG